MPGDKIDKDDEDDKKSSNSIAENAKDKTEDEDENEKKSDEELKKHEDEELKKSDEKTPKKIPQLYSIENVEIFKPGKHNGEEITHEDVQQLADNFSMMNLENPDFALPIKIGHEYGDGAPAAGWMKNEKVISGKLYADLVD